MKSATITLRGKTTTFTYKIISMQGRLIYATVAWESGEVTFFYKGMYGDPLRWECKSMPDDLILTLSEIFNKETPEENDGSNMSVINRGI